MDADHMFPASPGTPLFQVSPERVNQQRYDLTKSPSLDLGSHSRHAREASVQEKAARFESLAFQGKQLERRTNDAALRRAMLGREEAENEMRRYRDEVKNLRKQLEEGAARERKVGERLEAVMDTYGRAKETHAHTQTLWEKEIRRARKESFKSQSAVVKLQEELKAMRDTLRIVQSDLDQEKDRCTKREQEAFAARYQLVGVQEELSNMAENIKLVEQERDALRMIAKNEEIARIAAEGQLPLPSSSQDDEFKSPRKASRSSLLPVTVMSAASEEELERLKENLRWERNRAERAQDYADYLEVECHYRCCSCKRAEAKESDPAVSSDPDVELQAPKKGVTEIEATNTGTTVQARTPSCEPPSSADIQESNTSLMSLLENRQTSPSILDDEQTSHSMLEHRPMSPLMQENRALIPWTDDNMTVKQSSPMEKEAIEDQPNSPALEKFVFRTISTTRRIPLSDPVDVTPSRNTNPLDQCEFNPTMTREEALAQIRERRGRARSIAQGTLTPRKKMVEGAGPRRDISAPSVRTMARSTSRGRGLLR